MCRVWYSLIVRTDAEKLARYYVNRMLQLGMEGAEEKGECRTFETFAAKVIIMIAFLCHSPL